MYLHLVAFMHTEMTHVGETLLVENNSLFYTVNIIIIGESKTVLPI